MSVETDFRALLEAYAPLTALVADRVALNAVPEGAGFPLVVYAVTHSPITGIDGVTVADQCSIELQCWAQNPAAADQVADAALAALTGAPRQRCVCVVTRASAFDPDIGKDGTTLTVEWWA